MQPLAQFAALGPATVPAPRPAGLARKAELARGVHVQAHLSRRFAALMLVPYAIHGLLGVAARRLVGLAHKAELGLEMHVQAHLCRSFATQMLVLCAIPGIPGVPVLKPVGLAHRAEVALGVHAQAHLSHRPAAQMLVLFKLSVMRWFARSGPIGARELPTSSGSNAPCLVGLGHESERVSAADVPAHLSPRIATHKLAQCVPSGALGVLAAKLRERALKRERARGLHAAMWKSP